MFFKKIMILSSLVIASVSMVHFGEKEKEIKTMEKNGFIVIDDKKYDGENKSAILCKIVSPEYMGFEYDEEWQVCENVFDYEDFVLIENEEDMEIGDKYILEFEHDDVIGVEKYETK